jgi:hypothetical protein
MNCLRDVGRRGSVLSAVLLAAVLLSNSAAASPAGAIAPTSEHALRAAARGAPQRTLDLRLSDLQSLHLQNLQQAVASSGSDEADAATIAAAPLLLDQSADSQPSAAGIASLYRALRHPAQAWRVFLPIQLDADEHRQAYAAGNAGYVQVLDAQRLDQQAQLGEVQANGQRYVDVVKLLPAAGGRVVLPQPLK